MKNTEIQNEETVILGDSNEVVAEYYAGRLLQLEKELEELTLEQPLQILRMCKSIREVKNKLEQINQGIKKAED